MYSKQTYTLHTYILIGKHACMHAYICTCSNHVNITDSVVTSLFLNQSVSNQNINVYVLLLL